MRRSRWGRPQRLWVRRVGLATAVVMGVAAVPDALLVESASAADGGPGGGGASGRLALGGGMGGEVDERTGRFRASVPLVSLAGQGGLDASVALSYDQGLAQAGIAPAGLGAGWGVGLGSVSTEGLVRVVTPAGGVFEADASQPTGLARYPLRDLAFKAGTGTLPARAAADGAAPGEGGGVAERSYGYTLTVDDGRVQYFSDRGDLLTVQDRFGNRVDYTWADGDGHRLTGVVDTYGQRAALTWDGEGVKALSPTRHDGTRPTMTVRLRDGAPAAVVDPVGQETSFGYSPAPGDGGGGGGGQLLSSVTSPTGARTEVEYAQAPGQPGVVVARSVKVLDRDGRDLSAERVFEADPGGNKGHSYTGMDPANGRPAPGPDALFDSAAPDYTYTTELSDGSSVVRSTYNSLHLLKERELFLLVGGARVRLQDQALDYTGEHDGAPPRGALPANYAKPVRATVTYFDDRGRSRTTAESSTFDDHGRPTTHTDATGTVTATEYGAFGQAVKTTTTGADGTVAVTESTLTRDQRTVASTRSLTGDSGHAPAARTTTAFQSDTHGQVTRETVGWEPGARPDGDTGPAETSRTTERRVDGEARTLTTVVTEAADTKAATTTSTVEDLATHAVLKAVDPAGRATESSYDASGRETEKHLPGVPAPTRTAYTPTTTTVTGPDGHRSVETVDELGRTVKKTDNVKDGKITDKADARLLQETEYSKDGRTATMRDTAGRTTVSTTDALGRTVETVAPNGMRTLTAYDDAAHTKTSRVLPSGEKDPDKAEAVTTETLDAADRPTRTETTLSPDPAAAAPPVATKSYDGLGRLKQGRSKDVETVPGYGAGGVQEGTSLTPTNPEEFPGAAVSADTSSVDLSGRVRVKTLTPGADGEAARSGTTLTRDAAGRVVEEKTPNGAKTVNTYDSAGQLAETRGPDGTTTRFTYDPATGRTVRTEKARGGEVRRTDYAYDSATGALTSTYDPDDANSKISFSHDADGHTTSVAYPGGTVVSQSYRDDKLLKTATDATGAVTHYTYYDDGSLKNVKQTRALRDTGGEETLGEVSYTYDSLGRTQRVERGNKLVTEYGYTPTGQIRSEKTTRADGTVVTAAEYVYDSHNNLSRRTDTRPGTAADGSVADQGKPVTSSTGYGYDAYDRLVRSEVRDEHDQPVTTTAYTLNVSGDTVHIKTTRHRDVDGQPAGTTTTDHGVDAAGRLTSVTTDGKTVKQEWDEAGNLLTDHQGRTYTYNADDRPVTVTAPGGATTRYTYWADGTRRSIQNTGPGSGAGAAADSGAQGAAPDGGGVQDTTTVFYYDPQGALSNDTTTPAAGASTTASYLKADARETRTLTTTGAAAPGESPATPQAGGTTATSYLLHDRHGSTTASTAADGAVTAAWNYSDYGQSTSTASGGPVTAAARPVAAPGTVNPFTYSGEYTDPDGTQHLSARTYDPTQHRFTTRDTEALHNRYQYANANPITNTDPTGHMAVGDWVAFAVTAALSIASLVATTVFLPALPFSAAGLAITIAGYVADIGGLALAATSVADSYLGFLDNKTAQDAMFWTGIGLGVLGAAAGVYPRAYRTGLLFQQEGNMIRNLEQAKAATKGMTEMDVRVPKFTTFKEKFGDIGSAVFPKRDEATKAAMELIAETRVRDKFPADISKSDAMARVAKQAEGSLKLPLQKAGMIVREYLDPALPKPSAKTPSSAEALARGSSHESSSAPHASEDTSIVVSDT